MKYICAILYMFLLLFSSCLHTGEKKNSEDLELMIQNLKAVGLEERLDLLLDLTSYYEQMDETQKAYLGLFIFRALHATIWDEDAVSRFENVLDYIDFSIKYFDQIRDSENLLICYIYKGVSLMDLRNYTEASSAFFTARDIALKHENYSALGNIYFMLCRLYANQDMYNEALEYSDLSLEMYEKVASKSNIPQVHMYRGWIYNQMRNLYDANDSFHKALELTTDETVIGDTYNSIGQNFFHLKQMDSALFYLYKSLDYPYLRSNISMRLVHLAEAYNEMGLLDSAEVYVNKAFLHPIDIYYKRDGYNILRNVATLRNDKENMLYYTKQYNICNDSIRVITSQPSIDILEHIHKLDKQTVVIKTHRQYLVITILFVLLISSVVVRISYIRQQRKREEAEIYKTELEEKEEIIGTHHEVLEKRYEMLLLDLSDELKRTKEKYAVKRAKASFEERQVIDKTIYNEVLHLDKEKAFITKMNHILNGLPEKLKTDYPDISFKEIVWCCLFILQVSSNDMALILDYKQTSLYKFKQRLIKKLNFSSAKELEQMLYDKNEILIKKTP